VNAQLLGDLGHALPLWRTHPPSHISLDDIAVTTHLSFPHSPGLLIKGVTSFLKVEDAAAMYFNHLKDLLV